MIPPHDPEARSQPAAEDEIYDLESAAELSGMHPGLILELVRSQVLTLIPGDLPDAPRFDARALYRLRQIEMLREQESFGMPSACLVIDLIERLERAERELRALREKSP